MTIRFYKYLTYECRIGIFRVEINWITFTAQTILRISALRARVFHIVLVNLRAGFLTALKDLIIPANIKGLRSCIVYKSVFISLQCKVFVVKIKEANYI